MFSRDSHIKIVLLALILFGQLAALAQDYDYIQYTTDDGLPTNYVYGVVEDDNGYIWAYTENGISKFDGYTFRNFSVKDGLPANDIVGAIKGKAGKLWLHPYKSKPTYINVEKDSIVVFSDKTMRYTMKVEDLVMYIYGSKSGIAERMLFYENGEIIYNPNRIDSLILSVPNYTILDSVKVRTEHWHPDDLQDDGYKVIYISKDSLYYYKSTQYGTGLLGQKSWFKYNSRTAKVYWSDGNKNKVFSVEKIPDFKIGTFSNHQLGVLNKYLVACFNKYAYILNIEKEKLQQLEIPNTIKRFHLNVYDTTIMLSHPNGFIEYDFDGVILDQLMMNDLGAYYTLNTFFKDSKENLWVGSREGGLFFIPKSRRKTVNISSIYAKDKAFEEIVRTKDNQLLGITDNSGIYHIDDFDLKNKLVAQKGARFRTLIETKEGIIISSSRLAHLLEKDKSTTFSSPKTNNEKCFLEPPLFCCKKRYNLYNNLNNVLSFAYNPTTNILYNTEHDHRLIQKTIANARVTSCSYLNSNIPAIKIYYHLSEETLYITNHKGLYLLEGENIVPIMENDSLFQNILSLYGTQDKLWIGTESNGLLSYTFSEQKLEKIIDATNIKKIRPDTDTTLLLASNQGVLVIHQTDKEAVSQAQYSILDGLFSDEIQDVHSDGDQFIYVANLEGIQRIDRVANYQSTLDTTDLTINRILVNGKASNRDSSLQLSSTENDISIQYHLMSFTSNKKITYYTKLSPLETDWQSTTERAINYLDLSPDDYTFHLKASDAYENEIKYAPISIRIAPPFWQQLWFITLGLLALFGTIFTIIRYRDRKNLETLKKEKAINRRMAELQLSALRAQMNPHFLFNALGAIQYHIQINDVEAADNYLTRFAKLMRKYLDSSKEKMISLKQEIELLKIYTELEELRFEALFKIKIDVQQDLDTEDIYLPSMMIQPFIENAINHGLNERRDGKGILEVRFYEKEKSLCCEVRDNGIGRKKAKKNKRRGHKSRGMSIIEEKMQTLQQSGIANITIDVNDLYPSDLDFPGTHVIVKIKNLDDYDL